jgi:hypothetical protein
MKREPDWPSRMFWITSAALVAVCGAIVWAGYNMGAMP